MRKYFWSSAIAVSALAVGIYSAAGYAARHPTSLLARFATVVYKVGFDSPAGRIEQAVAGRPVTCQRSCEDESVPDLPCSPAKTNPLFEAQPEQPGADVALIEPIHVTPGVAPQAGRTSTGPFDPAARNPFPEIIPIVAGEMDDCPAVMPYCGDDQTCPPPMTNALRANSRSKFLDWFLGLYPDESGPCCGTEEAEESPADACSGCSRGPSCREKKDGPPKQRDAIKTPEGAGQEEQESGSGSRSKQRSSEAVNKRLEGLLQEYQSPETRPIKRNIDTMEFRPSDARKGEFGPIPF